MDVREVGAEQVAQDGRGAVEFADQLAGGLEVPALVIADFQRATRSWMSLSSSATFLPSATVRTISPEALRLDAHGQALPGADAPPNF